VLLGDKNTARKIAREAGVPVVPGSEDVLRSEHEAVLLARKLGYPVLIKAAAGGGGRGMRLARSEDALRSAFGQAQAEAEAAFGNGAIYLEKYIEHPRHVEVQILGDRYGNVVHLWERDCTVQRRHQKLIEESPAPRLDLETRRKICEAAVRLCKAARYDSAGTVEFIVDREGNFYFIEVNTRIQVEHPVTEMVTGIDLIKAQIRVAAGEPIPFRQEDIPHRGAEDPEANFRPSAGIIEEIFFPGGFGVRFDSHVHPGYRIPPYYDSLIGKLIVHQPTREEAIESMKRALRELRIKGVATTVPRHLQILDHPTFREALHDTTFVERTWRSSA